MGESKFKPSGASGLHLVRFPNPLVKVSLGECRRIKPFIRSKYNISMCAGEMRIWGRTK